MSSSWRRAGRALLVGASLSLGGAALASAAQSGCAKSGDESDVDRGGEGGVGGDGGMGGIGGLGGSGGEPETCSEQPCKLVLPQCGCSETDQCSLTLDGMRVCQPIGTSEPGHFCSNDCTPGYLCVNNGTTGLGGFCHKFCASDADCAPPGGLCALDLNNGAATVCSQNCDPITDVGCAENEPTLKCDIGREPDGQMRWFTRCVGSGSNMQDAACTAINQCSPGTSCIPVTGELTNHCLAWCDVATGFCPGGGTHTCNAFTTPLFIGAIQYGACVPLAGFP